MARTRRTYTPEFKAEAVKLVTVQGYSVAEAARNLGICENLIRNWKRDLLDKGEHAFPGICGGYQQAIHPLEQQPIPAGVLRGLRLCAEQKEHEDA
jgi:transposase-like protein